MDWHSSGITTSVIGALKRGLGPLQSELGIHVCGGRGQHSRKTPDELRVLADRVGFDGNKLTRASRLVAKVDSAALQDGFDLYLHGFFVTDDGKWTVVQQGMNGEKKQARRYHWHSETLRSFIDEPHSAIDGQPQNEIVNLAGSFDKLDINHRIPIRPSNLTHLNDARRANSILASVQQEILALCIGASWSSPKLCCVRSNARQANFVPVPPVPFRRCWSPNNLARPLQMPAHGGGHD